MPELPDIEVFKRYLDSTSLHQRIGSLEVRSEKILDGVSARGLGRELEGKSFESTRRHGKYLFVGLEGGGWLTLHFGMTGSLEYFRDAADEPAHVRLLFTFDNGYHLAFDDQRLFGRVGPIGDADDFIEAEGLGADVLGLGSDAFRGRLEGRRGGVKAALMDQQLFAGIGNIYSDEILFQARVHPRTEVRRLDGDAIEDLSEKTQLVLRTAIERGADPGSLPGSFLLPHRHEGRECPRSNGEIQKIKAAGRTAYYCPGCQPGR